MKYIPSIAFEARGLRNRCGRQASVFRKTDRYGYRAAAVQHAGGYRITETNNNPLIFYHYEVHSFYRF